MTTHNVSMTDTQRALLVWLGFILGGSIILWLLIISAVWWMLP